MPSLQVGVAQVDITPPSGTQVAGGVGAKRYAAVAIDPLYVKAIVFKLGEKRLCLVIIDVTILSLEVTTQIRDAAKQLGFEPDAVMVQATQTHTAPALGEFMFDRDMKQNIPEELHFIFGNDPAYDRSTIAAAGRAIKEAAAKLTPVQVGAGSGYEGRLSFNRRGVMKDGKVCMPWHSTYQPVGPTFVKYSEGPIDPEVGVLALRGGDSKLHALLVHFTCHPVCVYPKPVVSADWCGAVCDEMQRYYGPPTFAAVVNGACGDVNPWPFYDPTFAPDHKRMGKGIADVAQKVVEGMAFSEASVLEYRVKHVKIPVREVEPALLAEAKQYLSEHPFPKWADDKKSHVDHKWMKLASAMSVDFLRRREPMFDYEIQVFRIGDVAIVGMPGEPFAIGGIRVKMASPAPLTIIAHMTTQYIGYLPTREAFKGGGHEVDTTYWAKFKPEALDMVVDAAGETVKSLW